MATLRYQPKVFKQLKRIPKTEQRKIFRKLENVTKDPRIGKFLTGKYQGFLSLRAWPYRILYTIDRDVIIVYSIAHRQGAYK